MEQNQQLAEERFYTLLSRQLASSITPTEFQELNQLLSRYPDLRITADLFAAMWKKDTASNNNPVVKEAYVRHLLKHRNDFLFAEVDNTPIVPSIKKKSLRYLIPAAIVIICLVIGSLMFGKFTGTALPSKTPSISSVVTRYGNKSRVSLPDGSQVWLNAGSRLDYNNNNFNQSGREVELTGEAYFDIIHDVARPFIVKSGNMRIRVLGTTFNVKAYPEENNMETSLIKGSVEITIRDRPDDIYILKPNEKLVVSTEGTARKPEGNNYGKSLLNEESDMVTLRKVDYKPAEKLFMETAWVDNKLVFQSEKFGVLALRMERWYGVRIEFRNRLREELMFTGIFTSENIQQALTAMSVVHPFKFSMEHDIIYID